MQAALDAQRQAELEATQALHATGMIEAGPTIAPEVLDEAREERHREIEQMVKNKPDEMATLLRGWMMIDSP
jgi:flagellar M-ring protein FliF